MDLNATSSSPKGTHHENPTKFQVKVGKELHLQEQARSWITENETFKTEAYRSTQMIQLSQTLAHAPWVLIFELLMPQIEMQIGKGTIKLEQRRSSSLHVRIASNQTGKGEWWSVVDEAA